MKTKTEIKLEKGCGKVINHNIFDEIIICGNSLSYSGNLPNGNKATFLFELCPECKGKLKGYKLAKEEEIIFLNELQTKTKDVDTMMFCKLRMIKLKEQRK